MDEPLLKSGRPRAVPRDLRARIASLLDRQAYGVLCTRASQQPYASLMAYGFSSDLKTLVFSTPVTTRKFRFLCRAIEVAWLMDSRSGSSGMMGVEALTVTGKARRLRPGAELERLAAILVAKHPQLASFVRSPSCALFRVDVVRYFFCERFQEVGVWTPGSRR